MTTNIWDTHQSSDAFLPSKRSRTTVHLTDSAQSEDEWQSRFAGRPSSKSLVSWTDIGLLLGVLVCFAIAMGSVFPQRAAVFLGQTNQLVVVGFCLALMAIACQKQVSLVVLLYSVQSGRASLQDLEAILQNEFFVAKSSALCKAVLFMLTAVPLALSVGYKRCVGGSSLVSSDGVAGPFGLTAAPGNQGIGLGLSLISETYLPFWIDPNEPAVYGFNLLVASNTTGAVLDAPLPEYLKRLRASLRSDESVLLTASVNATVSEIMPISSSLRSNDTYWQDLKTQYGTGNWIDMDMFDGHFVTFANGPSSDNRTISLASIYKEEGQTLGDQIQQTFNTRREANGTWRVTSSNITLIAGELLESQDEALSRHNQSLIDNNQIDIVGLFGRFVAEYDWTRNPRSRPINTIPSLMATLLWARITTQCGTENNGSIDGIWREVNQYSKDASEVHIYRERKTLKRNPELLVVLLVLPVVSIFTFLVKMWFHSCPIDAGFGLISLLSAVNPRSLGGLHGAGLSGALRSRVGIRFDIASDETIEAYVGEIGKPPRLRRSRTYA